LKWCVRNTRPVFIYIIKEPGVPTGLFSLALIHLV
jgi:hypothetical protein